MRLSEESNQRFSKNNRLSKSQDLYECYTKGSKIKEDWLAISVLINAPKSLKCSALGIIIRKKVFKRAVDRNMFKRAVRECFRANKLLFQPSIVIVVSAEKKPPIIERKYFRREIAKLFSRIM